MKPLLTILLWLAVSAGAASGTLFTNSVSADAFVRAAAPTLNYGAAGALAVSGASAVNGLGVGNGAFDSFIRFNTAAMVTNFNVLFGANGWVVDGGTLLVTEVGTPNNAIFNRGTGTFEIRWIANDNWTEGSGTPNGPTTTGIIYNSEPSLLNSATDAVLGRFANAGTDIGLSLTLALPPGFVNEVSAGGNVGFFLTAVDPAIGFTFVSRSFGLASSRPSLVISASGKPRLAAISLSGADVVLTAANGVAGSTYQVLGSTSITLPLNLWKLAATTNLAANGNFIITLTNAAGGGGPAQQFFLLRTE